MDLAESWDYILSISRARLRSNITKRHVWTHGEELEVLGAAGELAARRFLGLAETLHTHFDGGTDIYYRGWEIDVKATHLTPRMSYRFIQWPVGKRIAADIIFLCGIDIHRKQGIPIGFVYAGEIAKAPINAERERACHEISVRDLRPSWELVIIHDRFPPISKAIQSASRLSKNRQQTR